MKNCLRIGFGILLICHALAHAVLPLRGITVYPRPGVSMSPFVPAFAAILLVSFSVALVALFAGGVAILGSRLLARYTTGLVGLGLIASIVALLGGWSAVSWWGLSLDAVIAGLLVAARNTGLAPVFLNAPPAVARWNVPRVVTEAAALALVGYIAAATALWPWHRTWGATSEEQAMSLPGDTVDRDPSYELIHAVTIDARPDQVWPWLVQLGQDRAGFYSYDWLERLFQADIHNADEIRAEWQQRAAGDFIRATQSDYLGGLFGRDLGWQVTHVDPPRAMVLENWGAFVLQRARDGRTRLLIRTRMGGPDASVWGAGLTFAAFELPHFIMQRRMMLGIKERAERRGCSTYMRYRRPQAIA
jgi:hypothetical protein